MNNKNFNMNPIANADNIILGRKYRITMLTSALVRLEYSQNGVFCDMPTQTVINRNFPKVDFKFKETDSSIEIETENIKLYYNKGEFSASGLMIKIYGTNMHYNSEWHYGMEACDLGGTARTLDNVNGAIPVESGIIGRRGFSVIDDSKSLYISDEFVEPKTNDSIDIYVFCYGHNYKQALKDFYYLCGETPMLPRYAMGNWWSRYYRYSEDTYMELMDNFEKENVPFAVAVIDMDWHLTKIDAKYGSSWTGYTWNKELFPNPKAFLEKLHKKGMHTTLNVHPAEGVRGFEDCYEAMAEAMEVDKENEEPIEFDCTSPKFMDAYFKYIHHPLEAEGVDFWWIDWQQGSGSKIPGLDPLWILNHYHFLDNARYGKRPMTFSRYAGPGSHRYPVGFSGDTHITWESLNFQPQFTAKASNIGYGWWSHDIGGHMLGSKDNNLELRWYQFGVFSPIMRLHSSCSEFAGKEPWNFPLNIHAVMNDFLRLRHRMIPYLYTMNYRAHMGTPLMLPMYYENPDSCDAYEVSNQYYFGSELIVAPITSPNIKGVNRGAVKVWLPEGVYIDIFTNTVYTGDRYINMYRDDSSIPVLAKAGGILPITDEIMGSDILNNPQSMTIEVFSGASNEFELYEDDGDSQKYLEKDSCITKISYDYEKGEIIIHKPTGNSSYLPKCRNIKLEVIATSAPSSIYVYYGNEMASVNYSYDEKTHTLLLNLLEWNYKEDIKVVLGDHKLIAKNFEWAVYDILNAAEIPYVDKDHILRGIKEKRSREYVLSQISARELDYHTAEALREEILAWV